MYIYIYVIYIYIYLNIYIYRERERKREREREGERERHCVIWYGWIGESNLVIDDILEKSKMAMKESSFRNSCTDRLGYPNQFPLSKSRLEGRQLAVIATFSSSLPVTLILFSAVSLYLKNRFCDQSPHTIALLVFTDKVKICSPVTSGPKLSIIRRIQFSPL